MSSSVNKPQGIRHHEMKSFGFGLRAFKKFPEILPLVTILGTACLGTVAFAFYSLYQKSDVIVNKRKEFPPWERVNPETPQKLLTLNQQYKRIPELDTLKQDMNSVK